MGNSFFDSLMCCNHMTQQDMVNVFWNSLKIRKIYSLNYARFLRESVKTGRLNINKLISEFFVSKEQSFFDSSKKFFKKHLENHPHYLKELFMGLIFICRPVDKLEKISEVVESFIVIDELIMDNQITYENEKVDHGIIDINIINNKKKCFILRKNLENIIDIFIDGITLYCLEFIFPNEDYSMLKANAARTKQNFTDKLFDDIHSEVIDLQKFLEENYRCLVQDDNLRKTMFNGNEQHIRKNQTPY